MRPATQHSRLPDWPERLAGFFADRQDQPFGWGTQDCVSFASDAAMALTGHDPLVAYRGQYATEDEAAAIIGDGDLKRFVAQLMAEFGASECPVVFAQRGDWAMVQIGNQLVTGVVAGEHVAAPGQRRLAFVPLSRAVMAWAI